MATSGLQDPEEHNFWHCVSSKVLDGQVSALVPQFECLLSVSLVIVSQPISEAHLKGLVAFSLSFLRQSHSVNVNSWRICDWFRDDFWRSDKQVITEPKAAPVPPTAPASDVITVSLGYAHANVCCCCWLSGNQTAFLAPTQTHNLEAFPQWHLTQLNYNVLHSEKLFKGSRSSALSVLALMNDWEIYTSGWHPLEIW